MTGPIFTTNVTSNINITWGDDDLPGQPDYWSLRLTSYVKAPYTGTFSIDTLRDDEIDFKWDGVLKINNFGLPGPQQSSFDVEMIAGQYYPFEIKFTNWVGPKYIMMSWSGPNTPFDIIPASAFEFPDYSYVQSYQVAVTCPTGYSGTDPSSLYVCKEICGDGLRVGSEV
jgi:hypothetical protein